MKTSEDDVTVSSTVDNKETPQDTSECHETVISNPGIAERLAQDIECFERYGFSFRREENTGNGVLTSPSSSERPFAMLQIHVSDVSLVASIGPFLRTFVRLCVHPICPQSLLATVIIKECVGSSGSSSSRRRNPVRKENQTSSATEAARSVAHAIHMLIRNSMGAALFLRLQVILPERHGADDETGLTREQVLSFMAQNDDGCYEYPSVEICEYEKFLMHSTSIVDHESSDSLSRSSFSVDLGLVEEFKGAPPSVTKPLKLDCLDGYDPSRHVLDLAVSTRMCTVRLTPVLYDLSQRLLMSSPKDETNQGINEDEQVKKSTTLMICLEKVSNLYRVLMLIRDYCQDLFKECENDEAAKKPKLVIVCRSEDDVSRFQMEAQKFIAKSFIDQAHQSLKSGHSVWAPLVLSVAQAVDLVAEEIAPLPVVGFDLHEEAATLSQTNPEATRLLISAGAVLLGYESDGIPKELDAKLTHYIQIDSRTSINVVAAFSILCHLILN